jgi:hypothetical protein
MIFDGSSYEGSSVRCPPMVQVKTLLVGHRGFGYCRDVELASKRGLVTFATLREPVSRIRSLFDYRVHKYLGGGAEESSGASNFSALIARYYATEEVEPGEARIRALCMQQTRFMCGYRCMGPLVEREQGDSINKDEVAEVLAQAKANLLKLDAVGVLERMNELIIQLKFQLGTDFVPPGFTAWPRENVVKSGKKSVVDAFAMQVLREWSAADIELYELADRLAKEKHRQAAQCMRLL